MQKGLRCGLPSGSFLHAGSYEISAFIMFLLGESCSNPHFAPAVYGRRTSFLLRRFATKPGEKCGPRLQKSGVFYELKNILKVNLVIAKD